jgi:hypothetical protein
VTITIPTVIAVDVESDVAFTLATGGAGHAGGPCDGFFPPAPGCTGPLVFNPTTVTHTATAIGGAGVLVTPSANAIWLAVFSNRTPANTVSLQASLSGATAPTMTAAHTRLVLTPAATSAPLANSGSQVVVWGGPANGLGQTTSPFNWTRFDQTVQLSFADGNGDGGGVLFNTAAAYTGTLTFTASH